jgi:PilZ domain
MLTNIMIEEAQERRHRPRLRLFRSLRLYRPGHAPTIAAWTEDISCQGFYFTSEHPFKLSERLEFELSVYGEELGWNSEADVVLRGSAEVVRIVPKGLSEGVGVACRIENYTLHRKISIATSPQGIFVVT